MALDEAITQLASEDPEKAELVKLRYFAGFSVEEAADLLGISRAMAKRHWAYARAWLYAALADADETAIGRPYFAILRATPLQKLALILGGFVTAELDHMSKDVPGIDDIFSAAIELASAEERAAYLDQACAGDAQLRRRLEKLLNAHFQRRRLSGITGLWDST